MLSVRQRGRRPGKERGGRREGRRSRGPRAPGRGPRRAEESALRGRPGRCPHRAEVAGLEAARAPAVWGERPGGWGGAVVCGEEGPGGEAVGACRGRGP